MKHLFVKDIKEQITMERNIILLGWIKTKRHHGNFIFFDIVDSTGVIQVVVDRSIIPENVFELLKKVKIETAIQIEGSVSERKYEGEMRKEILANSVEIIGEANKEIHPQPRSDIDIFDSGFTDILLRKRHIYIRNEKVMAILRFRHTLMGAINAWFRNKEFIEIEAPILTPLPLYDDSTAIPVKVHSENLFLTQCVGFYLESAVLAFERVYNIGPSFRAEESRSKRHLIEYWHIKAELAFGNLEDIIALVEDFIHHITNYCLHECINIPTILGTSMCKDGLKIPFPRISYRDAIQKLQKMGHSIEFGVSLSSEEETILAKDFNSPFWVVGIPRKIEPFPYVIDPTDEAVTRTADLIASGGYGELLGVAEKIHKLDMLDERMKEKGKYDRMEYNWLRELREYGCVPHIGFGMGVERFIRWILQIPHVRDAIPFPRVVGRKVFP